MFIYIEKLQEKVANSRAVLEITGEGHTRAKQHAFQTGDTRHYLSFIIMFSMALLLHSTVLLHSSSQATPRRSLYLHLTSAPLKEKRKSCFF